MYTADRDDRVVPAHSFKFAAALQHAHDGEAPVLIRIDTKAGHGRGKPVSKSIDEWADLWAFTAEKPRGWSCRRRRDERVCGNARGASAHSLPRGTRA